MSETNKWALPSGAKEQVGPKCRKYGDKSALRRQVGVPTYFFRSFDRVDDFTQHIKK